MPYLKVTCGDWVYDAVAAFISLADVSTDIWVAYTFFAKGQMGFFYASVSIFAVAQMCYAFLCYLIYQDSSWPCLKRIVVFCGALCVGPFVSLLLWLDNIGVISGFVSKLGLSSFEHGITSVAANEDKTAVWLDNKFEGHLGFFLESTIEAVPQVLTSTVYVLNMVLYKE